MCCSMATDMISFQALFNADARDPFTDMFLKYILEIRLLIMINSLSPVG